MESHPNQGIDPCGITAYSNRVCLQSWILRFSDWVTGGTAGGNSPGAQEIGQKVRSVWDKIHLKQWWAMQERELYPVAWSSRREIMAGVYPLIYFIFGYWAPTMCYKVVGTKDKEVNREILFPALKELALSSHEHTAETWGVHFFKTTACGILAISQGLC